MMCWSMDFMHDVLRCGRKFKTLNILDDHNRKGLAIDIAFSISSTRVTQVLDCLIGTIKVPPKAQRSNTFSGLFESGYRKNAFHDLKCFGLFKNEFHETGLDIGILL